MHDDGGWGFGLGHWGMELFLWVPLIVLAVITVKLLFDRRK